PLSEFFQALIGSELRVTVRDGRSVTRVTGHEECVAKLVKANPQMEALLRTIFTESAMKEMASPMFSFLPPKRAGKGDKWVSESKFDVGPVGTYETGWEYHHQGEEGKLTKLRAELVRFKHVAP